MIWKVIRRTLYAIIFLFIVLVSAVVFYLRSVEVFVTEEALPQEVYEPTTNINLLMLSAVTNVITANEQDVDTYIETFFKCDDL